MLWIIFGLVLTAIFVIFDKYDRTGSAIVGGMLTLLLTFFGNLLVSSLYDGGYHDVSSQPVSKVNMIVVNNDRYINDVQMQVTFTDGTKRQYSPSNTQLIIKPGAATIKRIEPTGPSIWFGLFGSFDSGQNVISTPTAPSFKE